MTTEAQAESAQSNGAPAVAGSAANPTAPVVNPAVETKPAADVVAEAGAEKRAAEAEAGKKEEESTPTQSSFPTTDDAGLNVAFGFLEANGINFQDEAVQAALTGDFGKVEELLKGKGVKGYENHLALAKAAYDQAAKAETEKIGAVKQIAVDSVGGEGRWTEILAFVDKNADAGEKQAFEEMLHKGGVQAKAAAMLMNHYYSKSTGTTFAPKRATEAQSGAQSNNSGKLSGDAYTKELYALAARKGGVHMLKDNDPDLIALRKRLA